MTNSKEAYESAESRIPEGSLFPSPDDPARHVLDERTVSAGGSLPKLRVAFFALIAGSLLAGCATNDHSGAGSRIPPGVREYQDITRESAAAVRKALKSLDKVAQPKPTAASISGLSDQVQHLDVESIRVRARVQAIQARGDAYFGAWSEHIAEVKDPQVREAAEHFRPELEQSFQRIKLSSKEAGDAFRPFLAGLRKVRNQLETSSGLPETALTDLVRTTRQQGEQVLVQFGTISNELHSITVMLTSKVR